MPSIRVHKIASVVYRLGLSKKVEVTTALEPRTGNVVVARVLSEKRIYNQLELGSGRMSRLAPGNVIVGALGRRRALQGFVGDVPESIRVGDVLHLLNMGGVLGISVSGQKDLGPPASVEILGMVIANGAICNVRDSVLPEVESLAGKELPPLVVISGTCMNAGKTLTGSRLIQELTRRGLAVHGGKLTGIACLRDSIAMEDQGALRTATFLDVGYPSTAGLTPEELVLIARTVIGHLLEGGPDLVVLELGDGIIGDYGVLAVLKDPEIRAAVKGHIFCAVDLVGAWGGHRFLQEMGVPFHLFSGPATDTTVGVEFIEKSLGVPAVNAQLYPERLADEVARLTLG